MPCQDTKPEARTPRAWPVPTPSAQPPPQVDGAEAARQGITWTRSERVDDGATDHLVIWEAECRVGELCPGKGRARIDYRDGSPYHQAATKLGLLDQLAARRADIESIAELAAKRRALHSIGLDCAEAMELVGGQP